MISYSQKISVLEGLSKRRLIGLISILVIILAIPLTVFIAQKRQEIRQHAASDFTLFFSDCSANSINSAILTSPWTITNSTSPTLCLYLRTNNPSFNLIGFDIQMTYGPGLNLNSIAIQNGGLEFNTQQRKIFDNSSHSFEIARASGNPTSIIPNTADNGTLLIATLNFTASGAGSGTINFTNPASSLVSTNKTGYLVGDFTPLNYTIGQVTPSPTPVQNALDVNRDGCIGIGDIDAWQAAYQGNECSNTYPDVNNDAKTDLLDYNLIFKAMLTGSSGLCQNGAASSCPYKQQ
ncbi:MAG: hypothetical protein M1289_02510 [Patescibacteria group bacterium]|nr:hypothetical protein [Patescibacteria group bacterium]